MYFIRWNLKILNVLFKNEKKKNIYYLSQVSMHT